MVLMATALLAGSLAGGAMQGIGQRKAAKKQEEQMKQALATLKSGGVDALGNRLRFGPNGFQYDLNRSAQLAQRGANNAIGLAGIIPNKTREEILRDNFVTNNRANMLTARANQAAAMRSGARTNSNLGKISNSYGKTGSQMLRDNYLQGLKASKNDAMYNANMRNALAQNANAAMQPLQNIQSNLQKQVGSLNPMVAQGQAALGQAQAQVPTNDQLLGNLLQGIAGVGMEAYMANQQQQNFNKFLEAYKNKGA